MQNHIEAMLTHLRELDSKIEEGDFADARTIADLAGKLKSDSHKVSRDHAKELQAHAATQIDSALKQQILMHIKNIESADSFIASLGGEQTKLLSTLHEIRQLIVKS